MYRISFFITFLVLGMCFMTHAQHVQQYGEAGKFGPLVGANNEHKGHAQCGHAVLETKMKAADPDYEAKRMADEAQVRKYYQKIGNQNTTQNGKRIIPVVVHVVHEGGIENISKAQIEDAIRIVNEDYSRTNPDANQTRPAFTAVAADMNIEFRLAKIDPDGNCTDGIVRVYSPLTEHNMDSEESALKNLSIWPTNQYHNIWVVRSISSSGIFGSILGYANLPGNSTNWATFGAVVTHRSMGSIGTANADGRTLTHELGHNLGLLHPFDGGCGSTDCANTGDYVCDTPPMISATFGCNTFQNTCSNDSPNLVDPIENYMSYDYCQNMFTNGQKARADAFINILTHFQDLISASNLVATGTNDGYTASPCAPKPEFFTLWDESCLNGDLFSFTNNSYNFEVGDTSINYVWKFENGTPATSTDENPVGIEFATSGYHDVTLIASNSFGSDTLVKEDFVYIKPTFAAPEFESFEDASFPNSATHPEKFWEMTSEKNNANWSRVTFASSDGNSSLRLRNIAVNLNDVRNLISPGYDLTGLSQAIMSFDYAYAHRDANSDCELRLYVSNNCGRTWSLRGVLSGSILTTAPNQVTGFLPDATEWKTRVLNLGTLIFSNDVRVKFEWTNPTLSNFAYLDNFKIFDPTTGIEAPISTGNMSVNVFPNPVKSNSTIGVQVPKPGQYQLCIYDAKGQVQAQTVINRYGAGNEVLQLDALWPNRAAGLYIIKLQGDGEAQTQKLIVNH